MPWIQFWRFRDFLGLPNTFYLIKAIEHLDLLLDDLFRLAIKLVDLILLGLLWMRLNWILVFRSIKILTFNHDIIPNFTLRYFVPISLIPSTTRAGILITLQNLPRIGTHFLGKHSVLLAIA